MNYRLLGKTGLKISEVGFGCIPIIRLNNDDAVRVLQYALDNGINFFDSANAYRDSEYKIGLALKGKRDKAVLATKSGRRDAATINDHLENSLRMLQTDYIDLYQLHQVSKDADWAAVNAPGGAMEVLVKAKEQGKVRHIGVTSHSYPMAVKLAKTGIFSSIMFPFNFIEREAEGELISAVRANDLGFLAMKPFGGGVIDSAELAFKYLRQFPEAVPIPGFDSTEAVDEILGLYEQANQVTDDDLKRMQVYRDEMGSRFCRRCEYCQPCPHGVMITLGMGYPILAKRMSPAVAVSINKVVMESVTQCVECGECITRCPYELPIPDMLKKHYDFYEQHVKASLSKDMEA